MLEDFSPNLSVLLSDILQTKLVNIQGKEKLDYQTVAKMYISNIYLVRLPKSLQGITLLNGYVVIKQISDNPAQFAIELVHRGYTLLTSLHEFLHFIQLISLNTNMKWLAHQAPEYFQGKGDMKKKIAEAGSILITKIFGYDLESINIPATEYLMDINNWNKKKGDFRAQFTILTNNNEGDLIVNERTHSLRLKQLSRSYVL